MNCPQCGYDQVPDAAQFCPLCGTVIPEASTQITVTQDVQQVEGGQITGIEIGNLEAIHSTIQVVTIPRRSD